MEARIRQLQAMLEGRRDRRRAGSGDGVVTPAASSRSATGRRRGDTERFFSAPSRSAGATSRSISPGSPLGQALIGRGAGDAVEYEAPGGMLKRGDRGRGVRRYGPRTLSEKVWDAHVVHPAEGEPDLLYIDLHLVHEVTSPQAFEGLRLEGRTVRRPDLTVATADHNVPDHRHRQAGRGPDLGRSSSRR